MHYVSLFCSWPGRDCVEQYLQEGLFSVLFPLRDMLILNECVIIMEVVLLKESGAKK